MESIGQFLLILIKSITLLIGLAMLIGGGLCSIYDISTLTSFSNSHSILIMLMWALLSLVFAICGYLLIHGVVKSWKKPSA